MRTLTFTLAAAGLAFGIAGLAAQPPGALVIRPGGAGAVPAGPAQKYPDKAGFIVVRPQSAGSPATPSSGFASVPSDASVPSSPRLVGKPGPAAGGAVLPAPVHVRQPDGGKDEGTVVLETWDATFLKGQKVGHFHVVVREYERDGRTYRYAVKTQKLTIARFGQVVDQWAEDATLETADGRVLTTRMRQGLGKDQKLQLSGKVTGDRLAVEVEGAAGGAKEIPWPAGVLGVAGEATLLKDRKPGVGEAFDYLWYEGRLNRVVRFHAVVKGVDELPLYEGEKPRKLLRVDLGMEPLKLEGGSEFRLPPSTVWADAATFEPLKMESDMPTFGGKMTVVRTTKEAALRPAGKVPDLFDVQSVKLDRAIPDVHDRAAVTYRVTLGSDLPPAQAFRADARQSIKNADPAAKTFELHVTAVRRPGPDLPNDPPPADPQFLSDCFFIDWDNLQTKDHARRAVAGLPADAPAWEKAKAVEAYVHRTMKPAEFSQAMATCSNVAKTLSGDCTEYAMFAAGLCRAVGVPSRTALGLVYATDRAGKPFLAYHMWFEVFVNQQWVALDATLGRGSVGPGHLKITDASWHDERSFAPLLPVLTVLSAQPKVEVVSVTGR